MVNRFAAALLAVSLVLPCLPGAALADNQLGYQLLSADQAAGLPRNGGALGMDVGRGQVIISGGMTFELLRVDGVHQGSPGAEAGFHVGDQIISVDGRVFPSVASFAAYVGSVQPGRQIAVDYMPSGGGPQQAQRVGVIVGDRGRVVPAQADQPRTTGLSTGTKIAIGVGAAALFGCYKVGCFSRLKSGLGAARQQLGAPQLR